MNNLERIANILKKLRESTGLSQTQVSQYLCIDQSYLSKVEAGQRNIAMDQLERLLDLYGYDMSVFDQTIENLSPVRLAFRANTITQEDLEIIATINRIAINSSMMNRMLEES